MSSEAHRILLSALEQCDCVPPEVTSLQQLNFEQFVGIVLRCLQRLHQANELAGTVEWPFPSTCSSSSSSGAGAGAAASSEMPRTLLLPKGVAAKHRLGSQLGNCFKQLGYHGECGYNNFLYPTEKETRNMLAFLLSKMPRVEPSTSMSPTSQPLAQRDFSQLIAPAIETWKHQVHLPQVTRRASSRVPPFVGCETLPVHTCTCLLCHQISDAEVPPEMHRKTRLLFESFPTGINRVASMVEALSKWSMASDLTIESNAFEQKSFALEDAEHPVAWNSQQVRKLFKKRIHESKTQLKEHSAVEVTLPLLGETGPFAIKDRKDRLETSMEAKVLPVLEGWRDNVDGEAARASPAGPPRASSDADLIVASELAEVATTPANALKSVSEQPVASVTSVSESTEELEALELAKQQQREHEESEQLKLRVEAAQSRLDQLEQFFLEEQQAVEEISQRVASEMARGKELERQLATRKRTLEMLPQAHENIAKLEAICAKNAKKLEDLEAEWQNHRQKLEEEEQALLSIKDDRKARCRRMVEEMRLFRQEMKEMAPLIQQKMDQLSVLEKKYTAMPKAINRNMYTSRILDIIKQVERQKLEIKKIIGDIRSVQKQINFSSEKLKRSEAVADEQLFQAAKETPGEQSKVYLFAAPDWASDQAASSGSAGGKRNDFIECYRCFAQVRELFEELILMVGDIGKKENAARDFENWIAQLQTRESTTHLDKILQDLEAVKKDNAALSQQVQVQRARMRKTESMPIGDDSCASTSPPKQQQLARGQSVPIPLTTAP